MARPMRKTERALCVRRNRSTKGLLALARGKDKTDKHLGNRHKWDVPMGVRPTPHEFHQGLACLCPEERKTDINCKQLLMR